MDHKNVAIVGKMRGGKDTVADYFRHKGNYAKINFGDAIKKIVKEYFPNEYAKGKPRNLLQRVGQDFRKIDPLVWVNEHEWQVALLKLLGSNSNIVTSDLRQMNEYEYLKANGYVIIKVVADDEIRKARITESGDIFSEEDFYHETELATEAIPYDYLITNNGTYEELQEQIEKIYGEIQGDSTT